MVLTCPLLPTMFWPRISCTTSAILLGANGHVANRRGHSLFLFAFFVRFYGRRLDVVGGGLEGGCCGVN